MERVTFVNRPWRVTSLVLAAALVFCAAGCNRKLPSMPDGKPKVKPRATLDPQVATERLTKLYGGPAQLEAIRSPDKVEVWRFGLPKDETSVELDNFDLVEPPVVLTPGLAAKFSKTLLNADDYLWDVEKQCGGYLLVKMRFTKGDVASEFAFCFDCSTVRIIEQGKIVREEDIDHLHYKIASLLRDVFPQDPYIQAIQ